MTRINVVPVEELSDQWLIAEYRELPRALKGNISIKDAPNSYKLGKGHVKWARKYGLFTYNRYLKIIKEIKFRGFKINFIGDLYKYILDESKNDYKVNLSDLEINKQRLIIKYNTKPTFYRWTNRTKPNYLK